MNEQLTNLVQELQCRKMEENSIRQARIKIEEQIADLVPGPESGQKTVSLDDGIKLVVKRGLNYKANCSAIVDYFRDATCHHPPIKTTTKQDLDVAGYEWYHQHHPELWGQIAQHVTVTPKKVSVSLITKGA